MSEGIEELYDEIEEERFTRKKHDASFPTNAIKFCLRYAGVSIDELDAISFYDKPFLKFERLLETYYAFAPKGLQSFVKAMPVWLKEKLLLKDTLKKELTKLGGGEGLLPELMFSEHHKSHAASAFYPSPYDRAAVLCLDGVGEWATTSAWHGKDHLLEPLWEIDFPHFFFHARHYTDTVRVCQLEATQDVINPKHSAITDRCKAELTL